MGLTLVLNAIKQGDVSYKRIEQIADEAAKSFIISKLEALVTATSAIILTLKKDPSFVTLLLEPFPAMQDPHLQNAFNDLALKAWDKISAHVNITLITLLFERMKNMVDEINKSKQITG